MGRTEGFNTDTDIPERPSVRSRKDCIPAQKHRATVNKCCPRARLPPDRDFFDCHHIVAGEPIMQDSGNRRLSRTHHKRSYMKPEKRSNLIHRILNRPRLAARNRMPAGLTSRRLKPTPSPKHELKRCSLHNPAGTTRLEDNRTPFNRLNQVIILHGPWRPQSKDINLSAVWEERNATKLGRPKR